MLNRDNLLISQQVGSFVTSYFPVSGSKLGDHLRVTTWLPKVNTSGMNPIIILAWVMSMLNL